MRRQADWDAVERGVKVLVLLGVFVFLVLSGCAAPPPPGIDMAAGRQMTRWHDADLPVTCWLWREGVSCLPDAWLTAEPADVRR